MPVHLAQATPSGALEHRKGATGDTGNSPAPSTVKHMKLLGLLPEAHATAEVQDSHARSALTASRAGGMQRVLHRTCATGEARDRPAYSPPHSQWVSNCAGLPL